MAKTKVQELTELVAHLKDARDCSRNLGRMYNYMFENEYGQLQFNFPEAAGMDRCTVGWGDVMMTERCRSMVYTPNNEERPLRFIFDYFYDNQNLWVYPGRMSEDDIQRIIDWIYKTINY